MTQIQKVSSYLLFIFNLLLIGIPVIIVLGWLFTDTSLIKYILGFQEVQTPDGSVNLGTVHWTVLSKTIGFVGKVIGILPLFLGLFALKSIFHNYHRGEIFSIGNSFHYRHLGWLFFSYALLAEPLSELLMVLAVTLSNPPGHRYITLSFGTPNIEALFCGMIVIVISWVMIEASKLKNEQDSTI